MAIRTVKPVLKAGYEIPATFTGITTRRDEDGEVLGFRIEFEEIEGIYLNFFRDGDYNPMEQRELVNLARQLGVTTVDDEAPEEYLNPKAGTKVLVVATANGDYTNYSFRKAIVPAKEYARL